MDDRRKHYRHTFPTTERVRVVLASPGRKTTYIGEMLELSVGGCRVQVTDAGAWLEIGDRWVTKFSIPGIGLAMEVPSAVTHSQHAAGADRGRHYGIQFLPSADPKADSAREDSICRFLLDEQIRAIRQQRVERPGQKIALTGEV